MRNLYAILVISLFFSGLSTGRAQKKLAIVGSSTSACTGPSVPENCYVAKLNAYYNKQAPNDTIADNGFAVPGYNVYNGMPTSYTGSDASRQPDPAHNITAALDGHPDVVLVNYPTNGYDVFRADSILVCLRTIRDSANKRGVPCFVTTTQPRTSGDFATHEIKAKMALLKDSILAEFGNFAVDFWTGLITADTSILYDAGDGIHMNDMGHDILFQRVAAKNVFLATLPATFIQFNTTQKNNSNFITWATAKEINVSFYEIQRSSDGIGFSKIATVSASNNNGNNQYQYTDDQPLAGWSYYKILIVDKDGKKMSTPVMRVHSNIGKLEIMRAFAHTASQVVLELQNNEAQMADIQVLNNMGMVIYKTSRKVEMGSSTFYLNTPVLSNGVYHIRLATAKETMVGSFVKN